MSEIDQRWLEELEARYDPEMAFRPTSHWVRAFVTWLLVLLGIYHFYTAGFGIPAERLAATGFGAEHPIDPGEDPAALARNRRIEFKLTSR